MVLSALSGERSDCFHCLTSTAVRAPAKDAIVCATLPEHFGHVWLELLLFLIAGLFL